MPWNPDRLRKARNRRGWTQQELADRVDAHKISVARWELGTRQPRIDELEKLAKALRVKVTDLLR